MLINSLTSSTAKFWIRFFATSISGWRWFFGIDLFRLEEWHTRNIFTGITVNLFFVLVMFERCFFVAVVQTPFVTGFEFFVAPSTHNKSKRLFIYLAKSENSATYRHVCRLIFATVNIRISLSTDSLFWTNHTPNVYHTRGICCSPSSSKC